jgi:hypothetical protein
MNGEDSASDKHGRLLLDLRSPSMATRAADRTAMIDAAACIEGLQRDLAEANALIRALNASSAERSILGVPLNLKEPGHPAADAEFKQGRSLAGIGAFYDFYEKNVGRAPDWDELEPVICRALDVAESKVRSAPSSARTSYQPVSLKEQERAIGELKTPPEILEALKTGPFVTRTSERSSAEAPISMPASAPVSHASSNDARDAARYRWMRSSKWYVQVMSDLMDRFPKFCVIGTELDGAIDAEMNTPIAASATRRSDG